MTVSLAGFDAESAAAARRNMVVVHLRGRGMRDERVLEVMERVPREAFLPPELSAAAYEDAALPIAQGQTISQPYIVALMTEQLRVRPQDRVLEIGTGSGYQTAVLANLAAAVFTVERLCDLSRAAAETLRSLGIHNVSYRIGDGTLGWPEHAPYDRIMVTAGAPRIPPALVDQLVVGGRLVLPVGEEREQTVVVVEKRPGRIVEDRLLPCRFVKLIGAAGW